LVELLVVIAIIAILAGLLLPALNGAKARAQTVQCLNNLRQLQVAWYLYADDHDDRIPPNYAGELAGKYRDTASWVSGWLTYETFPFDAPRFSESTNLGLLVPGGFGSVGAYTKSPAIYKCPADKSWIQIAGQRHSRVRSVAVNDSMNSSVNGDEGSWHVFRKTSAIVSPGPSQAFVFVDEHEDSIGDGCFAVDPQTVWPDMWWAELPTSRHRGAGTFSFADGHTESRKWVDSRTLVPVRRVKGGYDNYSPQNKDVLWVQERATSKKQP